MKRPRASSRDAKYTEHNALAWGTDDPDARKGAAVPHVDKRKKKQKGAEVVFDPDKHRDYLTGFHKRKLQRRKAALQEQFSKEKKERLQERAERKAELRKALHLERYETGSEASDGEADAPAAGNEAGPGMPSTAAEPAAVAVYDADVWTTTVTTEPLRMHSDSEPDASGSEEEEDPAATKPKSKVPQQQRPPQQTKAKAAIMRKLLEKKKKRKKKGKGHAASRGEEGQKRKGR